MVTRTIAERWREYRVTHLARVPEPTPREMLFERFACAVLQEQGVEIERLKNEVKNNARK